MIILRNDRWTCAINIKWKKTKSSWLILDIRDSRDDYLIAADHAREAKQSSLIASPVLSESWVKAQICWCDLCHLEMISFQLWFVAGMEKQLKRYSRKIGWRWNKIAISKLSNATYSHNYDKGALQFTNVESFQSY